MKIFTRSRRDLAAISARIAARSRRDRGAFLAAEISPSRRDHGRDRGEITARYGKSRRPKTRRDLAAILAEMREISAAKNAPRSRLDSRRDRSEIWKSRQANRRRDVAARSRRDTEISAAKTRRDREVISRRDMDISASRRGLGGSLAGICGEKRNSWRSKSYCYPVEKRNSRQPN